MSQQGNRYNAGRGEKHQESILVGGMQDKEAETNRREEGERRRESK